MADSKLKSEIVDDEILQKEAEAAMKWKKRREKANYLFPETALEREKRKREKREARQRLEELKREEAEGPRALFAMEDNNLYDILFDSQKIEKEIRRKVAAERWEAEKIPLVEAHKVHVKDNEKRQSFLHYALHLMKIPKFPGHHRKVEDLSGYKDDKNGEKLLKEQRELFAAAGHTGVTRVRDVIKIEEKISLQKVLEEDEKRNKCYISGRYHNYNGEDKIFALSGYPSTFQPFKEYYGDKIICPEQYIQHKKKQKEKKSSGNSLLVRLKAGVLDLSRKLIRFRPDTEPAEVPTFRELLRDPDDPLEQSLAASESSHHQSTDMLSSRVSKSLSQASKMSSVVEVVDAVEAEVEEPVITEMTVSNTKCLNGIVYGNCGKNFGNTAKLLMETPSNVDLPYTLQQFYRKKTKTVGNEVKRKPQLGELGALMEESTDTFSTTKEFVLSPLGVAKTRYYTHYRGGYLEETCKSNSPHSPRSPNNQSAYSGGDEVDDGQSQCSECVEDSSRIDVISMPSCSLQSEAHQRSVQNSTESQRSSCFADNSRDEKRLIRVKLKRQRHFHKLDRFRFKRTSLLDKSTADFENDLDRKHALGYYKPKLCSLKNSDTKGK